jgi:hypothetical protein
MKTTPKSTKKRPRRSQQRVVQLSSAHFTWENGAERNGVFLWENHNEAPYLRAVEGWKVVGWTKQAPWPGISNGFAAMLEKTTPASPEEECYRKHHLSFDEGTQIWQHICEDNFKRLNTVLNEPSSNHPT